MKVAIAATEDKKVSAHFGHAEQFLIYSVEGEKVEFMEARENPKRRTGGHFHETILSILKDVDTVIAGGMGRGAYSNLIAEDKKVVVTSLEDVEEAVRKLAEGKLEHEAERVHSSHSHHHHHAHHHHPT